jgi:antitoxin component YwqK of YwqJK toxin-antitoxin module
MSFESSGAIIREMRYDNGQISSRISCMGTHTEYKEWYRNGQISSRYYYKRNPSRRFWYNSRKLSGEQKEWHENGQLMTRSFYNDGIRIGECKIYTLDGQIRDHFFYRNGMIIDGNFNRKKKLIFIKLRRYLYSRSRISNVDIFLISDLINS